MKTIQHGVLLILIGVSQLAAQNDWDVLGPTLDYTPSFGSRALGTGVDASNINSGLQTAISFDIDTAETKNIPEGVFKLYAVDSKATMEKLMAYDVSLSARSFWGSAAVGANALDLQEQSSQSLSLVITYSLLFGPSKISALKLTPNAQITKERGYSAFKNAYGTHYIDEIQKGAKAFVVISITDINNQWKRWKNQQFSGKGKFGVTEVTAKVGITEMLNNALSEKRTSISVNGYGGNVRNWNTLAQLLTGHSSYADICTTLSEYIRGDPSSAVPVRYHVSPYKHFGLVRDSVRWGDSKERNLIKLYEGITYLTSAKSYLSDIIDMREPISPFLNKSQLNRLKQEIGAADSLKDQFLEIGRKCFGGNCTNERVPSLTFDPDSYVPRIHAIQIGKPFHNSQSSEGGPLFDLWLRWQQKVFDRVGNLNSPVCFISFRDESEQDMWVMVYCPNRPNMPFTGKTALQTVMSALDSLKRQTNELSNDELKIIDLQRDISPSLLFKLLDVGTNSVTDPARRNRGWMTANGHVAFSFD